MRLVTTLYLSAFNIKPHPDINNFYVLPSFRVNHTVDVIHSLISQTRARIQPGSYPLARRLAEESIQNMLRVGDNADVLLAVHAPPMVTVEMKPDTQQQTRGEEYQYDSSQQQYYEHTHESRTRRRVL